MANLKITIRQVPDEDSLTITTEGATPPADTSLVYVVRAGGVWSYALGEGNADVPGYSSRWDDAFLKTQTSSLDIILVGSEKLSDLLSFLKSKYPEADLTHIEVDRISLP